MATELDEYPQFGHKQLKNFNFEDGLINLNHGSFGAVPNPVLEASRKYQMNMEANPDKWFRYQLRPLYEKITERLAEYVSANKEDIVLVENASSAVNGVLRSMPFAPNDGILYFNTAYSMVLKALEYIAHDRKVSLVEVKLHFPASTQEIIDKVKNAIEEASARGVTIKLACFSHITSVPAVVLPVKELGILFESYNIMSLVDGAHAVGQIPLNVTSLNVDFYLSNAHKWLFTPKGAAFLWVRKDRQATVHPAIISYGYRTDFQEEHFWVGTRDYSPLLAVADALLWRKSQGDKDIMDYSHKLALWAGKYLADLWKTETLLDNGDMIGAMNNIRLPTDDGDHLKKLVDELLEKYKIYLVVYQFGEHYYCRVSAQIYNERSDFEVLGKAVLSLLEL